MAVCLDHGLWGVVLYRLYGWYQLVPCLTELHVSVGAFDAAAGLAAVLENARYCFNIWPVLISPLSNASTTSPIFLLPAIFNLAPGEVVDAGCIHLTSNRFRLRVITTDRH